MKKVIIKGTGEHPWVYSGKVADAGGAGPGEQVEVHTRKGRFVGCALFNPHSGIALRFYSREREALDLAGISARIKNAADRRRALGVGGEAFRLVYAESDMLPGLVVDVYGPAVVFQVSSVGMEALREEIVSALGDCLSPGVIYEKSTTASRRKEGLPDRQGVVQGEMPSELVVEVSGLRMVVNPGLGKTGLYLDQRFNWLEVAGFVNPGDALLDLFSYTGGFSLAALRARAASAVAVDISHGALSGLERNLELNDIPLDLVKPLKGDAWKLVSRMDGMFDLVVIDPPSVARSARELGRGQAALAGLAEASLKLLRPGGTMAVFSCSNYIKRENLVEALASALRRAGRVMVVALELGQPVDHPVTSDFPEALYLTGVVLREV